MPEDRSNLAGRVALVTGGARGIGLAIAKSFIEDEARVTIVDTGAEIDGSNPDAAVVETAAENLGKNAAGCSLDIGSAESAQEAVRKTIERWGRLDIVINNAAILRDHFIFKARPNDFEEVVRVNLAGYYYVLAAASPVFREQAKAGSHGESYHWGRVVNIVSTAGFYGNYGQSSYASAKNGVVGLTRVAALDLGAFENHGQCSGPICPISRYRYDRSSQRRAGCVQGARAQKSSQTTLRELSVGCVQTAGRESPAKCSVCGGREVFLFSQPRPVRKFILESAKPDSESIRRQADEHFDGAYTELETDLESFNSEPVI